MSKILVKYADDKEEFYGFTVIDASEEDVFTAAVDESGDYSLLDFVFQFISDEEAAYIERFFPGGFGIDFYGDLFPSSRLDDVAFLLGE